GFDKGEALLLDGAATAQGVFLIGEAHHRFGDFKDGGDFLAVEFAMFKELEVGAGSGGFFNFCAAPKEERTVGSAGFAVGGEEIGEERGEPVKRQPRRSWPWRTW